MSPPKFPLIDSQKEAIIQLVKTLGYNATDFKFEHKQYLADSLTIADTLLFKNIPYFFAQFIWDGTKLDMLIYPSKLGFYHTQAEYLHWTEGFILLKQWLNSLETIIQKTQKNGFQMESFQLYPIAERAGIQKITFQNTEYYFELGGNEKSKQISYRPGETADIEVIERPLLSEYDYFAKWLARLKSELNLNQIVTKAIRDLKPLPKPESKSVTSSSPLETVIPLGQEKSPKEKKSVSHRNPVAGHSRECGNPVAGHASEPGNPVTSQASGSGNSVACHSRECGNPGLPKFTQAQLELIISHIQYLRAELVKFKIQQMATGKQVELANQELDYLVAAADRVTPVDWSYIACTGINIIASILKLDPVQGKELFQHIQEMLKQLPHHPKHRIIFLPEEKSTAPEKVNTLILTPPEKSSTDTEVQNEAKTFI
ncbi:MAG: hypothetical protein ACE14V_11410 [bacterium]